MKRPLRIALLMSGLLWLAPAVRALPLAVDASVPGEAGLAVLPDAAALGVAVPGPVPAPTSARDPGAGATSPHASHRSIPTLLFVGLLGLLILGTDHRVLAQAVRDAARPGRRAPPRLSNRAPPADATPDRRVRL